MRGVHCPAAALEVGDLVFWGDRYLGVQAVAPLGHSNRVAVTLATNGALVTLYYARDELIDVRRPLPQETKELSETALTDTGTCGRKKTRRGR